MRFARLKEHPAQVIPANDNPIGIPIELVGQQVFEPCDPRVLLHRLLDLVSRCGPGQPPEATVALVKEEVEGWQILP